MGKQDPSITGWRLDATRLLDGLVSRALVTHFHAVTAGVARAAVRDLGIAPPTSPWSTRTRR